MLISLQKWEEKNQVSNSWDIIPLRANATSFYSSRYNCKILYIFNNTAISMQLGQISIDFLIIFFWTNNHPQEVFTEATLVSTNVI